MDVQRIVPGGEHEVFARCADYQRWPQWLNVHSVDIERLGLPEMGKGCVRVVSVAGLHIRELVTEYAEPEVIKYELVNGLPVHNYVGTVDFEPCFGGTRVRWRCEFEPNLPGTGAFLRRRLQRLFSDGLDELARQLRHQRHAA